MYTSDETRLLLVENQEWMKKMALRLTRRRGELFERVAEDDSLGLSDLPVDEATAEKEAEELVQRVCLCCLEENDGCMAGDTVEEWRRNMRARIHNIYRFDLRKKIARMKAEGVVLTDRGTTENETNLFDLDELVALKNAKMPDRCREIYQMWLDGYSRKDMAEGFFVSDERARQLLCRAQLRIYKWLVKTYEWKVVKKDWRPCTAETETEW